MKISTNYTPECEFCKKTIWSEDITVSIGAGDFAHERCSVEKKSERIKELSK